VKGASAHSSPNITLRRADRCGNTE
jgi:hypothetical protein